MANINAGIEAGQHVVQDVIAVTKYLRKTTKGRTISFHSQLQNFQSVVSWLHCF
jgi:hypothetical protein